MDTNHKEILNMQRLNLKNISVLAGFSIVSFILIGCGAQPGTTNVNLANSNANSSNLMANVSNMNSSNSNSMASSMVETKEPEEYQATVTLKLEAIGGQQKTALPTLAAKVARSGSDRRMEFSMPAGGRVVYLDKAGTNYLVLPEKRQYAELNQESLGFDVRRMLMPEQIVKQVKNMQGVQLVGEEKYNGRDVIKYRYGSVANTQTQAGNVQTESFLLVDKATGLPLHSETVSQSQTGGNVQGYSGLRIITEITEIQTDTAPELFQQPTDYQKIESEQVRSQVNLIFNSLAQFLGQVMMQGQTMMQGQQPAASPMVSPAR
ncbi:MAG: hypothetical protein M3449_11180 [Acidobacteriota bacterium]|nr:hypothetical protein [Acidobacteriota bacterium]